MAPTLQLDWTIDLWNKLNSSKKATIERYLASEAGQRVVKSQLISDIAENYYTLLALDYKSAMMQEYISLQKNAVKNCSYSKRG